LLFFFFSQSLKNNINTSEWTQMEQEESTRKGQYNLATGWDISWEERASKQELATHLRTRADKQAHSLEARVCSWVAAGAQRAATVLVSVCLELRGYLVLHRYTSGANIPVGVRDGSLSCCSRQGKSSCCVIKCALATYAKTSCFVFLVICLSSYPKQGQQPKLKPFSCLRIELYISARTEGHHLLWLLISAPRQHLLSTKLHRSVRLLSQPAAQASGKAEHNHSSASSPQQSQQQNCSCQQTMQSVAGQAQRCAISKLGTEALQPGSSATNETTKWVTCTGLGRLSQYPATQHCSLKMHLAKKVSKTKELGWQKTRGQGCFLLQEQDDFQRVKGKQTIKRRKRNKYMSKSAQKT